MVYTVGHQRDDGSWPYGESPGLGSVDNFHTIDALATCADATGDVWPSYERGVRFPANRLLDPDGAPRYTPESRWPVDAQCVSQSIQTLSIASVSRPEFRAPADRVVAYALRHLRRRDAAFVFQRRRLWPNRTLHAGARHRCCWR